MVDYGNGETCFFETEDELKDYIAEIAKDFENFTVNEDVEFYNLVTGEMVNVETEAKVTVTIV